jgi:hypothetical protein
MMPSLPIKEHWQRCFCFLTGSRGWVRIHPLNLQTAAVAIISRKQPCTHLHGPVHFADSQRLSLQPSRPHIASITGVTKSP